MQFTRIARVAIAALTILAASVGPAAARTPVDPTTLNPAPPDFFNAVCSAGGTTIICTLAFTDPEIVDEPTGILCGGVEAAVLADAIRRRQAVL